MAAIKIGSVSAIGIIETVMLNGGTGLALVGIGGFIAGYVVRDLIEALDEKLQ